MRALFGGTHLVRRALELDVDGLAVGGIGLEEGDDVLALHHHLLVEREHLQVEVVRPCNGRGLARRDHLPGAVVCVHRTVVPGGGGEAAAAGVGSAE